MRFTDLSKVMFPVAVRNAYYPGATIGKKPRMLPHPTARILVNAKTDEPLGMVSSDYKVVTNKEALELAKACFAKVFDKVDAAGMEIFNVIFPKTLTFCQIDLIHRDYKVNIWRNEVYVPFLRVTNSYNRSRALSFDLGFCRKLCDNGMIFEKETVGFRYDHSTRSIGRGIKFETKASKLKELEERFTSMMGGLRDVEFPMANAFPLLCKLMGERFDLEASNEARRRAEAERYSAFRTEASVRIEEYFGELGNNGYSFFNVLTEYASPNPDTSLRYRTHGLQKGAGRWAESFLGMTVKGIDWDEYLGEFAKYRN